MEFLKAIFGDKPMTYDEFVQALNAHNGNEANKDKLIKLANLASGEYVGKGKHDALQALLDGKTTELETANSLIADLKKGAKGNEEMQGKITNYETVVVPQLQKQLKETKEKAAIKFMLQEENCSDVEYVTFKLYEKLKAEGKVIELDENENVKGREDLIAGLKTQLPTQFSTDNGGSFEIDANPLPRGEERKVQPTTLADAIKQTYENK